MDCTRIEDLRQATADLAFIASHGQAWLDELSAEMANQTQGMPNDERRLQDAPFGRQDQVYELARLLRYWLRLPEGEAKLLAIDYMLPSRLGQRIKALAIVAAEISSKQQRPQKPKAAAVKASVNRRLTGTRNGGIITIASGTPDPLVSRGAQWR